MTTQAPPITTLPPPSKPQTGQHLRFFPVPTKRLYQLFLLGILIPLLTAFIPQVGLVLGWVLLIIYNLVIGAIAYQDWQRSQWQFNLQRSCEPRLSIGRDNLIRLQIQITAATARETTFWLREHLPLTFTTAKSELKVQLKPNTTSEITYSVFPTCRGQFRWAGLDLRQLSLQGLLWRACHVPIVTTVDVYPDLIGLRSLSLRLSLEATGSLRRRRHMLGGTEFSELRDYSLGDDLRLLDWKATARRGRPLIRTMEPERDQPLIILLDRGRLMTANVAGLQRFDWALNATLSLALTGLRRGDRVGVCVFDHEIKTWIAPQSGQSHLAQILDQVYNLEPVLVESNYIGTVSRLLSQYTRRALVVLLTDLVDATASAELLTAMGRLMPRFLPFCVALRDPHIDAQAQRSLALRAEPVVDQVQTLFEQAVALDLLHQRTVAFAQLKQKGVLVLDAPANVISEQLVDRYLLLKARGSL